MTGASGFIGSAFMEQQKDHPIKTFSFQRESLQESSFEEIDTVVHLAALVHQPQMNEEKAYMEVNCDHTIALAKKAKQEGVKHFIFMSTIKVYGEESENGCFDEESQCNPVDAYGRSKLEAEKGLQSLEDETFVVSIIRTPVVYGPKVKANIFNIVKLLSQFPYLPFANIANRRSMVYIGNLIQLIEVIIDKRVSGVFLASDSRPFSTSEFFSWISKSLYDKEKLFYLPGFALLLKLMKPNIYQRLYTDLCLDATQTQKKLDFNPKYTTRQGVDKMIAWFKDDA